METSRNHRRRGHDAVPAAGCAGSYQRSFSSSLLDAVYRSIDGGGGGGRGRQEYKGDSKVATGRQLVNRPAADERTATVQKTAPPTRRGSEPVLPAEDRQLQPRRHHQRHQKQRERSFANSTSSSSNSSYGGFSSSDVDKPAAAAAAAAASFISTGPHPKPIRTGLVPPETRKEKKVPGENNAKQNTKDYSIGGRFRGSKLYRELKKAKTPVSPGARLAGFLNTLFMSAGGLKKGKAAGNPEASGLRKPAGDASLCSSAASSSSRSRLSRTPSSMGNAPSSAGGDVRRSVRFLPVSFVVDEDCRRHGHRSVYPDQKPEYFRSCPRALPEAAQPRKPTMEATREFMRWYEEKKKIAHGSFQAEGVAGAEEDDGAASCSSSDLFELENLPGVGGGGGELPVYETTRVAAHGVVTLKKIG